MDRARGGRPRRAALDGRARRRETRALRALRDRGNDRQGDRRCHRRQPKYDLFAASHGSARIPENGVAPPPAGRVEAPMRWLGPVVLVLAIATPSAADTGGTTV